MTQTVEIVLKDMQEGSNHLSDSNKGFYLDKLLKFKEKYPYQSLLSFNLYAI